MKDTTGTPCGFVIGTNLTNCIDRACNNAPTPFTDFDCYKYKDNCTISNATTAICIEKKSNCTSFQGFPAQCQSYSGNNLKCWSLAGASNSQPSYCKIKECTDNTTSTTNEECKLFLNGCKTKGKGCVPNNISCSALSGNNSTCSTFKASDGTNLCKVGASISDACTDKQCSDNASSTSDDECRKFMTGCLTKGFGCIAKTEACSKYQGTQSICSKYVGNGLKCWNSKTVTSVYTYCVDKLCSDDEFSTTDISCDSSLTGCITKGIGCIHKTAACRLYQGTQAICSAFKGSNGTKICWNITGATKTTPCIEKACSNNQWATSDSECEAFIPRATSSNIPQCVTQGQGCVAYPRVCQQFIGTLVQCSKFTAIDGPCRTTATGSISASGTCTPRICTEALNSNNTDTLCQANHPSCVTNGYGCVTSVSCSMIQESNSCTAKTECGWINNCRSINTDCSSLTKSGASICVNTPDQTGSKKCSWFNNACRSQTCEDLSSTLTIHDQCQAIISTCTTTGSGCITMASCSAYSTEVICKTAKTINIQETCIWDTNYCRVRKCTDAPLGTSTDIKCQTYLTGCKTNGISCVASLTCSSFLTFTACKVDGNGRPCFYVNGACYSFTKCEDVAMNTHLACQQFSPLCTSSGDKCIPITMCALTKNQISCVIGTDGTCGWVSADEVNEAKCLKFEDCSDIRAADISTCTTYGKDCITDGFKCVKKSACSTYRSQISCVTGGQDGVCIFTQKTCRLRECTDATVSNNRIGITSHFGCQHFMAKTKCVTNGISCIAEQKCASYKGQVECVYGTDGLCVYDLGANCRVKVCTDFLLATNAACSVALAGAACISNGTNCIAKATCLSYTSQEACNGGGSDGLCAFTFVSTTMTSTCKLMTACTDANQDWIACNAKSEACKWEGSTNGQDSKCQAYTCATKAQGQMCQPVPSFDLQTYTICGPSITEECTEVNGNTLQSSTCQLLTKQTFTWDESTQKCIACFTTTDNGTDSQNNHPQEENTTADGLIIKSIMYLVILTIQVV